MDETFDFEEDEQIEETEDEELCGANFDIDDLLKDAALMQAALKSDVEMETPKKDKLFSEQVPNAGEAAGEIAENLTNPRADDQELARRRLTDAVARADIYLNDQELQQYIRRLVELTNRELVRLGSRVSVQVPVVERNNIRIQITENDVVRPLVVVLPLPPVKWPARPGDK